MASAPARGIMVLLAALALGWLVASYHGVRQIEQAQDLVQAYQPGKLPTVRMAAAVDDLEFGRRFSADNAFLLTEAALRWAAGRRREAAELAREATEREPDNVGAWYFAYAVSDSKGRRRAIRREIARLNPWAADAL
jgi:hypothetical protein